MFQKKVIKNLLLLAVGVAKEFRVSMRCPKSRFPIWIIVFDKLKLIIFVSQGLTLSTATWIFIALKSLLTLVFFTPDLKALDLMMLKTFMPMELSILKLILFLSPPWNSMDELDGNAMDTIVPQAVNRNMSKMVIIDHGRKWDHICLP